MRPITSSRNHCTDVVYRGGKKRKKEGGIRANSFLDGRNRDAGKRTSGAHRHRERKKKRCRPDDPLDASNDWRHRKSCNRSEPQSGWFSEREKKKKKKGVPAVPDHHENGDRGKGRGVRRESVEIFEIHLHLMVSTEIGKKKKKWVTSGGPRRSFRARRRGEETTALRPRTT